MVSTRAPKTGLFEKGEKVLCYEPDPTKARVLYDSKILGTSETRDKRGRKLLQYKIHFQGWSSSWDRKVNADFVLKDTAENRQLQQDLAEKAQLQLGAYLYRRERSSNKKKHSRKTGNGEETASGSGGAVSGAEAVSPSSRNRGSSEDNYSSASTFEKNDTDFVLRDDCETESYCSSIESTAQDEVRVHLRLSERLRLYLEYDYDMTVKQSKQHVLPTRIPVVAILENFVKHTAIKMAFSSTQSESTTRRRNTLQRSDKKDREFDKLIRTVSLLKEVADGLRIYFDFIVTDYLLYNEEKVHALSFLSEENLKNFTYVAVPGFSSDFLNPKCDLEQSTIAALTSLDGLLEPQPPSATNNNGASANGNLNETSDEPQKRKLRSHRSEDGDVVLENCLSSIASTSSGASTPMHANGTSATYMKSCQPSGAASIPPQLKEFLQKLLSWRILPTNAAAAPSMIFGAPHLARLIVKLPEFLNTSTMNDEKLKVLLQHLDTFTNYLESRKEWFTEENYYKFTVKTAPDSDAESFEDTIKSEIFQSENSIDIKCEI